MASAAGGIIRLLFKMESRHLLNLRMQYIVSQRTSISETFPPREACFRNSLENCAVLMGAIALMLPLYTISLGPSITKSSVRLKFNTNGPVNVFEICPKSVIFTNIKKSESSNCFHRLLIFLSNNQASGSCRRF